MKGTAYLLQATLISLWWIGLLMSQPFYDAFQFPGIGQGISISILFCSVPILVYSLLGAMLWQWVIRPIEEREMKNRFGESYLAYRKKVKCWIPRL